MSTKNNVDQLVTGSTTMVCETALVLFSGRVSGTLQEQSLRRYSPASVRDALLPEITGRQLGRAPDKTQWSPSRLASDRELASSAARSVVAERVLLMAALDPAGCRSRAK